MPNKSKTTTSYPEIDEIREDLDSLRNNVVELTKHISKNGAVQTKELKSMLTNGLHNVEEQAQKSYKNLEKGIKEKPGQSVAMAFAAGLVASILLGRR